MVVFLRVEACNDFSIVLPLRFPARLGPVDRVGGGDPPEETKRNKRPEEGVEEEEEEEEGKGK